MPPRRVPRSYVCIVCGAPRTSRCPPCWDGAFVTAFCSRDHQKLVWLGHRDFCGDNARPFVPPALSDFEISLARACTYELGLTEMMIKNALTPNKRREYPLGYRLAVTSVRADINPATVEANEARLPASVPTYTAAGWYRELEELQENADLADDDFSDSIHQLFQTLATLLYLGRKPAADRPAAFWTDFIVDVVKRILEALAPLNEVGHRSSC
ncbi:hypothetical protein JCM3774_005197 [Rhodotorula dairenensis]